jgi:divinyl chlorophyllide a 8-vinyl-reductase
MSTRSLAAQAAGVTQVVLLSAICVQKPRSHSSTRSSHSRRSLLIASGVAYSIVRPDRVLQVAVRAGRARARGKPFLVFGDGTLTACKPISTTTSPTFLADCLDDAGEGEPRAADRRPRRRDHAAPAGRALFALLGRPPRFKSVPVALLDAIVAVLGTLGASCPARDEGGARAHRPLLRDRIDARMGPGAGRYDADATPSTGTRHLADYYAALLRGEATLDRGEHAVF